MSIEFIYFDLGNVLVCFEVQRVLAQMAAAAGLTRDQVAAALFDHGLQRELELGRIRAGRVFRTFRELTGTKSDLESIRRAATEIFWLNEKAFCRWSPRCGRRAGGWGLVRYLHYAPGVLPPAFPRRQRLF